MSGTSLDGMDLAAVEFCFEKWNWQFSVAFAETVTYPCIWLEKLKTAPSLSGEKLLKLHSIYGRYIGNEINRFIRKTGFIPDVVASHGHTIFHQPENHFTFQLGSGAEIAAVTQTTTVADFRSGDVALGGQGAPLVPAGDRLLFAEFDYCLNLGGFANISYEVNRERVAFDICPVNIVLNHFAGKQGFPFDKNGELGKSGQLNYPLLQQLNDLPFYRENPPKSLGREWVENCFLPVIDRHQIPESDILRTLYEHIARQIGNTTSGNGKMLVTGGGALNTFLMERVATLSPIQLAIPSSEIINFKEAIIFAFLGVLRIKNEPNCFASVTGAKHDHSAGVVFPAAR